MADKQIYMSLVDNGHQLVIDGDVRLLGDFLAEIWRENRPQNSEVPPLDKEQKEHGRKNKKAPVGC